MEQPTLLRKEIPESRPHVMLVTLDNPPVNASCDELNTQILETFQSIQSGIRCIVLTGAGEKAFSAGGNVKKRAVRTTPEFITGSAIVHKAFDSIRRCSVPVVGAVNGYALGYGLALASCCDILVAAEDARFGMPEVNVGLMGGSRHVARILPEKVMRYLMLTGRKVDARFMASLGAVHTIVPRARLLEAAYDIADEIAAKCPIGVRMLKESINLTEDMPLNEGYRTEQMFTILAGTLPDTQEAARAWVEKRKPVFSE
jgi:enoyl-CoA hydratase